MLRSVISDIYAKCFYHVRKCFPLYKKVMNSVETLNYIYEKRLSVSRYGDGELAIMRKYSIGFQKYNPTLSQRLKEIANERNEHVLVCIPYPLVNCDDLKHKSQQFWKHEGYSKYHLWIKYFHNQKILGDTQISRFYIDFKDGNKNAGQILPLWFKIWENRNILIVEGKDTRLGVGNDLLKKARSVRRIIAPSLNAFEKYEVILDTILQNAEKDDLILLALGPTATVLAVDLSKQGLQAIDMGHIDIEYEWFLMNAQDKVKIANKAVNEAPGGLKVEAAVNNEIYNNQIIGEIH